MGSTWQGMAVRRAIAVKVLMAEGGEEIERRGLSGLPGDRDGGTGGRRRSKEDNEGR